MKNFIKIITRTQRKRISPYITGRSVNFLNKFIKKGDLKSMEEFVTPHIKYINEDTDLKGFRTTDPETIKLTKKIIKESDNPKFLGEMILGQPNAMPNEIGSMKVAICNIDDYPTIRQKYEEEKIARKNSDVMLSIGGPAPQNQTVIATLIPEIRERLNEIIYMVKNYHESNANHSAMQTHARHGNALNADSSLTGHSLMLKVILRNLIGITPEEAINPDYRKIDISFTIDPKKLRIYLGNEVNYWKQRYRDLTGQLTEHNINRLESVVSQEIIRAIEKESKTIITSNSNAIKNPTSLHISMSHADLQNTLHENEEFIKAGIKAKKLSDEEKHRIFANGNGIIDAWEYEGDASIKFDSYKLNEEIATKQGAKFLDQSEITKIMLDQNEEGDSRVVGVVTKDGQFHYATKVHISGGYKIDFEYDKETYNREQSTYFPRKIFNTIEDFLDLQKPLPTEITTATGISINAVFKMTDKNKELLSKQLSVTNSHWTLVAKDKNEEYAIIRMTGGGNTGSELYNPAYFLNLISNTRDIFGDDLIGIFSTYGCARAVNSRNTTEFVKLTEGLIVSYGKGGTGITKGHYEAAQALMMLGFEKEVVEYFNKFTDRNDKPLGDELAEVYEHAKNVQFIHDNTERTNRRMGFNSSISIEEAATAAMVLAAATYTIHKKLKKKEDKNEDNTPNTKISSKNTTQPLDYYPSATSQDFTK